MCCTCVCPRPASCSVTQLQNRPPEMSRSVDCAALASALGLLPLSSRSRTTSHPKYHNTKCLRLRLPSATSPPLRVTQRAAGQGSLQCHCKKCRLCCVGACRRCNSESSLVTHQASEPGSLQCHGTRPGCNGPDRDCVDLRPPSALRPPLPLPPFRQFKMRGCATGWSGKGVPARVVSCGWALPLAANCSQSQLDWCLLRSCCPTTSRRASSQARLLELYDSRGPARGPRAGQLGPAGVCVTQIRMS